MKELVPALVAPLSGIAFLGGLALAVFMWMSPSGGGMFVGLGTLLGWLALGSGNLLSWLLNVVWWLAAGRPSGLGWLVTVQGAVVLASLAVLAAQW
jgi:hypothetical protein